jgi:hypothetical protein
MYTVVVLSLSIFGKADHLQTRHECFIYEVTITQIKVPDKFNHTADKCFNILFEEHDQKQK